MAYRVNLPPIQKENADVSLVAKKPAILAIPRPVQSDHLSDTATPELETLTVEAEDQSSPATQRSALEAARDRFSEAYAFPSCPGCGSYALYRATNAGNYDCQTCGLEKITEARARGVA